MSFWESYVSLCNSVGKSPNKVAEEIGISSGTITGWKYGTVPTTKKLLLVADYFGVPADALAEGKINASNALEHQEFAEEESEFIEKYRALDGHGRKMVDFVVDEETARMEKARVKPAAAPELPKTKIIPLFFTPAAAGYANPVLDEDYTDYEVPFESPADFAITVSGDSMEPALRDKEIALVKKGVSLNDGDIGAFYVDGESLVKQYCTDGKNIYLFSLNRARKDADRTLWANQDHHFICHGKVLLPKRYPLP